MPATELLHVRAILFDAVGTLIRPSPPAAVAYHQVGRQFGSSLDLPSVERRFRAAMRTHGGGDNCSAELVDVPTDELAERARWRRVVEEVFDDTRDGELFEALWRHFADPQNWQLFEDAGPVLAEMRRLGCQLGIASNFDRRLRAIWEAVPQLQVCRWLFCSSEMGFAKPSPSFFHRVASELDVPTDQILLVGDDVQNDYQGARAAGWQALLVKRSGETTKDWEIGSLAELSQRVAAPASPE